MNPAAHIRANLQDFSAATLVLVGLPPLISGARGFWEIFPI